MRKKERRRKKKRKRKIFLRTHYVANVSAVKAPMEWNR